MTCTYTYTCAECGHALDPAEYEEYRHTCDGWWDDHGIFSPVPPVLVSCGGAK